MSIDIPSFIMSNRINSDIKLNVSRLTTCSSSTEDLANKPTDSNFDMSSLMANPAAAASSSLDIDMYCDFNNSSGTRPSLNVTDCVSVPSSEHVAEIVGRQGCKIKALRNRTNTYIKTPTRGENPVFIITGRRNDVAKAKSDILLAAEHFTHIRASRVPNKLVSTTSITENNSNNFARSFNNSNTTNICSNNNKINHVSHQRYCFDDDSVFSYDCEDNCSSNMSIAEESTTSKQQDKKYCFATTNNLTEDTLRTQSPSVSYFSSSSADSNHSFVEDVRRSVSRSPLFDQNSNTDNNIGHDKDDFQASSTLLNISYSMEFSNSTTTDSSFMSKILFNDTICKRFSSNKSNNNGIAVRATCGGNDYNSNIEYDAAANCASSPVVIGNIASNVVDHIFPDNKSYDGSTNQCSFSYPDNLDVICCEQTTTMQQAYPASNSFNCINKRTATNDNHSKNSKNIICDGSAKPIESKAASSISNDHKCLLLRETLDDRSQTCYDSTINADATTIIASQHPNDERPLQASNDTINVSGGDGSACRSSQVKCCNKNHVIVQLRVPYHIVGLVVGPKGATIKRIQQTTHTYIVTPSKNKDPVFEITGRHDQVFEACRQIEAHVISRTGSVDLIGNRATAATYYGSPPLDLISTTAVTKSASLASSYVNYDYNIPNRCCYHLLPSTNTNTDGATDNNFYESKEDSYNSVNFSSQQPPLLYRRQYHPHNYDQLASSQFSTTFISPPNMQQQQQQLLNYYRHYYSQANEHTKIDTFTNKVLDHVLTYRPHHPVYDQQSTANIKDVNETTTHKLIMIDTNDTTALSSTSTSYSGDSTAADSGTHTFYSSPTSHLPLVQEIDRFYPYGDSKQVIMTTTHGFAADNDDAVVNNNIDITAQYSSNLSNNQACIYDETVTSRVAHADSDSNITTISSLTNDDDVGVVCSFTDNEFSQDYNNNNLRYVYDYNELLRRDCTIQQHPGNYMDAVNVILSHYNGEDVANLYSTIFSTKITDKELASSFQMKQNFYDDSGGGAVTVKSDSEDSEREQMNISQIDHSSFNGKLDEKENEEQRFMASLLNSKSRISSMTIAYCDAQSQGHHTTALSSTDISDHFVVSSTRQCDYSKIFNCGEYCSMHDSISDLNSENMEEEEHYDFKNIKFRDYTDGCDIASYSMNSDIDDPLIILNTVQTTTPIVYNRNQQSIRCSNRFQSKLAKRFNYRKANCLAKQSNALTTTFADGRNVPSPVTSAASTIQQQTIDHRDNVIFQPFGCGGVDFFDGQNFKQQRGNVHAQFYV
ncbi:hypothetical protein GJ496_009994 [Pomphorhynchus laevis]|nr:hypothetical protein GJ496_009994 [Pomphorhynchus laevis]